MDCFSSPCLNDGLCLQLGNSFLCHCPIGFNGSMCEEKICLKNCGNGGSCVNGTCVCPPGYLGDYCEYNAPRLEIFKPCDSSPCLNNGKCTENGKSFQCDCTSRYNGNRCQFRSFCPPENTSDEKGDYKFESLLANGNPIVKICAYGPQNGKVTRHCIGKPDSNAIWGPVLYTKCNSLEKRVFASSLTNFTKNATEFNSDDIRNTTNKIEKLFGMALNDSMVASKTFEAISNMLEANETAFVEGNSKNKSSDRLINMIDDFLENVVIDKEKGEMEIKTNNLFVKVQLMEPESHDRMKDMTLNGLSVDEDKKDEIPVLTLPADVLNAAVDSLRKTVRVHFVAHRNAKLFREYWSEKENDPKMLAAMDRATLSARPVLTVSLANFPVKNISNAVSFSVKKPLTGSWMCAYWLNSESRWSTDGMSTNQNDENITCSASHMTSFSILFDPSPENIDPANEKALSIISYVGSGLSVLGLILTVLTYSLFRVLNRDRSGKILLNLCVSMLLLNVSFLFGAFQSESQVPSDDVIRSATTSNVTSSDIVAKDPVCTAVAVFTHYFVLTTVAWMTVEAFNMYQLLIYVFATSETRFLLKRCFAAWGAPAIIVGVTAAVNISYYNPNNEMCMLSAENPYVYYITLIGPCCVLLLVNTVVFVMVSRVLFQPRNSQMNAKLNSSKSTKPLVTFAQVRGAFTVMTLLGITWIFGALAIGKVKLVFHYIFCVCNSLQGFTLFVVRCLIYPQARQAWTQLFKTGTLKKSKGAKVANTLSSNNTQVKQTMSNASATMSTSASSDTNHRNPINRQQSHNRAFETPFTRSVESLEFE